MRRPALQGTHELMREVIRYLDENEDAKDSIEGFYWWLPYWMNPSIEELRCVVHELLARDWVIAYGGAPAFYGINAEARDAIRSYLHGGGEPTARGEGEER